MTKRIIFSLLAAAIAAIAFRPTVMRLLQERNEE